MTPRRTWRAPARVAALATCLVTLPCLWDSDTLDDELRGLPDAHRLIVGRWHRHGPGYYEERVRRLASGGDLTFADYDDLAVAYEHLGRRDDAVATMARKALALGARPDAEHQYRYHANLGTFLAHRGDYAAALVELEQAVALEPNAHFGRERFQIDAVRYVAAATQDPGLWERENFLTHAGYEMFVCPAHSFTVGHALDRLDLDSAYQAIAGMLRFGGREGAELYRALGDVFARRRDLHLAWWAWQRALERGHPAREAIEAGIAALYDHWRESSWHEGVAVPPSPGDFARARANADAWLAAYQALEASAVAAGEAVGDPLVLRRLLAAADAAVPPIDVTPGFLRWLLAAAPTPTGGFVAVALLCVAAWARSAWRRRRQARTCSAAPSA